MTDILAMQSIKQLNHISHMWSNISIAKFAVPLLIATLVFAIIGSITAQIFPGGMFGIAGALLVIAFFWAGSFINPSPVPQGSFQSSNHIKVDKQLIRNKAALPTERRNAKRNFNLHRRRKYDQLLSKITSQKHYDDTHYYHYANEPKWYNL